MDDSLWMYLSPTDETGRWYEDSNEAGRAPTYLQI